MGRRPQDLARHDGRRLSQPLHDLRPRRPQHHRQRVRPQRARGRWVADLIVATQVDGVRVVEADADEQECWTDQVEADARRTLFASHDTWFNGGNVAGKARVYPTYTRGATTYYDLIEDLAARGYPGLHRLGVEALLGS